MKTYLCAAVLLGSLSIQAQQKEIFFASSSADQSNQWLNIQSMQLSEEQPLKTVYDFRQSGSSLLNGYTRRPFNSVSVNGEPTESMVAATAYANDSRRLFFIPMKKAELRWVEWDAKGNPSYYAISSPVLGLLDMEKPENQITRMTVGMDGFGYALTNDGNHLIRFSTGSKPAITDLGNLIDASANGQQSVHSQCSSWGGDLVAAADGSLYLITLRNHIYQISAKSRIATYKGIISGLPQNFTSNAAAATANGDLIVGCSNGNQNCFIVDVKEFQARPAFTRQPGNMNFSDMASGYFLFSRFQPSNVNQTNADLFTAEAYQLSVFPNPVSDKVFRLNFKQSNTGMHTVQVTDLSGQLILQTNVNISGRGQAFTFNLPAETAGGLYLVRVTDHTDKIVHVSKLVVQ
jgi:hypothetical protein